MTRSTAMIELGSSSVSLLSSRKDSLGDDHFRWQSIQKFICFACTYSSTVYGFDIFSQVCENVRVTDFILCQVAVGISYLCMDSFIKQYTKRFDCNQYLNPLLRGISYGRFVQTSLFLVLHAAYLADSLRYLLASFREIPPWTNCQAVNTSRTCISTSDIYYRCRQNMSTDFYSTSAFQYYEDTFRAIDRNTLTTSIFVQGLVWMLVFFVASVSEESIVKIFKLAFMSRTISTLVTLTFLIISTDNVTKVAFSQLVDISAPSEFMESFRHVTYVFGIGFLGIYDFGTISAYTMIDTATVIFAATFTILALLRSMIVKMLFIVMRQCIFLEDQIDTHLLFYGILPLCTDFMYAHKLYVFYFYGNLMMGSLIYMTNLILIQAKFLSYEFRSVKMIYIVGLLCSVGLMWSILLLALFTQVKRGETIGLNLVVSYLGGIYVAIVMWLYGLKKFCTDIQFWLHFRPTKYWTITWSLLPVALFIGAIRYGYEISQKQTTVMKWTSVGWVIGSVLFVASFHVKTMGGFLMNNNLNGLFKSSKLYGPPEAEDRKRRLYYSEYTRQRKCKHHCLVIDDWFDCNHEASVLMSRPGSMSSSSSDASLMNLYDSMNSTRLRSIGTISTTHAPPS